MIFGLSMREVLPGMGTVNVIDGRTSVVFVQTFVRDHMTVFQDIPSDTIDLVQMGSNSSLNKPAKLFNVLFGADNAGNHHKMLVLKGINYRKY